MIDLRSDTVTTPTPFMREVIFHAEVGDDAYGEDKEVNRLQDYCKELFQVESALFVTSGMLGNRLAILSQTSPGDEVVTDYSYHINFFDSAAAASICQVVLNTRYTEKGILTPEEVQRALDSKPRYHHFAQVKLVSIENSINGWAGKIFPFDDIKQLKSYTQKKDIRLHLDGARLFNAHVETQIPLSEYARYADTISVCFSKGLGAPFGSMLMGKNEIIEKAKRYKVWLGSGVHQIGFYAKAALYALQNNIESLKQDHTLAQLLAEKLKTISELTLESSSVETNMVQFSLTKSDSDCGDFLRRCHEKGLLLFPWLPRKIRAVVHRPLNEKDILKAVQIIQDVIREMALLKNGQKNAANL
jgi:threonine aldolase